MKSLTPQALSAAVSDIGSVISMNDRIAGSAPGNGSRAAVGEDLVAMTNCRLQARNFITQDAANGTRRMKRCTNATPLNVICSPGSMNDSIRQLQASDLESTATSTIKKPRTEVRKLFLLIFMFYLIIGIFTVSYNFRGCHCNSLIGINS